MCMKKLVILSSEWKTREFCQAMMAIAIGPWLQFGMPHCPKNNLGVNLRIKTKHIQVEADATNSRFFLRWTMDIYCTIWEGDEGGNPIPCWTYTFWEGDEGRKPCTQMKETLYPAGHVIQYLWARWPSIPPLASVFANMYIKLGRKYIREEFCAKFGFPSKATFRFFNTFSRNKN